MKTITENGVTYHTLKTGQYLSDVITELPAGIINKSETGIGATTVELNAPRNSIIVEPLKVTASAKAYKHDVFYLGSATNLHPETDKKKIQTALQEYLADPSKPYKKIVVVADSLVKLERLLGASYKDYFLMIDEADRMQLQANFRDNMTEVYRRYKLHDVSKRCMITATPVKFNDPELSKEQYIVYRYDKPIRRKVTLLNSTNAEGCIVDRIKELLKQGDEKIVIAYNEVLKSYNLAEYLVNNGVLPVNEVSILCSNNSKSKAGVYFRELDSSILPTRVVFKTSAYFNGFDIDETYHLITYVHPSNVTHSHSINELKQIAGRCRVKSGLLSECIVYDRKAEKYSHKIYTLKELVDEANSIKNAYMCLSHHLKHSTILREQSNTIFGTLDKVHSIYGYPLVVFRSKNPEVSYLSIDSILDRNRTIRTEFSDPTSYENHVKKANDVTMAFCESKTDTNSGSVRPPTSTTSEVDLIERNLKGTYSIGITDKDSGKVIGNTVSSLIVNSKKTSISYLAYTLYEDYRKHVDNEQLIERIVEACNKPKAKYHLMILQKKLVVSSAEVTDTIRMKVSTKFQVGKAYSQAEIIYHMNMIYDSFKGSDGRHIVKDRKLVALFHTLVKTTLTSKKGEKGRLFKVVGYNTANVEVFNPIKEFKTPEQNFKDILKDQFIPPVHHKPSTPKTE